LILWYFYISFPPGLVTAGEKGIMDHKQQMVRQTTVGPPHKVYPSLVNLSYVKFGGSVLICPDKSLLIIFETELNLYPSFLLEMIFSI